MELTKDRINDISQMIEDDMTFEQIAKSLGISEAQCISVLLTIGVEEWKPAIIEYVIDKQQQILLNQEKLLLNQEELLAKQSRIDAKFKSSTRITTPDVKKRLGLEIGGL